jgi:hypothetical protein
MDEAWSKRGSAITFKNDPKAFVVPMGRIVGTNGETSVRIVVDPNTREVITGYPQ